MSTDTTLNQASVRIGGLPSAPRLLDITEAAEYLHTSVRHMRDLVYRRRIAYYKVGKLVRFDPTDLDLWLQSARVEVRA
jgi:excisionase family DNA binding protein